MISGPCLALPLSPQKRKTAVFFQMIVRSKTRSFALFDLGFSSVSSTEGMIGFLVITCPLDFFPHTQTGNSGGQVQGFSFRLKTSFTIRSSSE